MKRVLVLAYYFPPIGGAGAQRPAKFARYLPALGFDPVVVTGPGDSIGRWTPPDETLSADIPASVVVHRVPGPEPAGSSGWRSRGERWFGLRPRWSRWWIEGAVDVARQAGEIDLIYSWMSPYESAVAAARLSKELDRPWVADLGDPWALDEMMVFPSAVHRWAEFRRMSGLLKTAAAIVMSTPEAAARVRERFPELADKPVVSIPNGYDAADFDGATPVRHDSAFRIVHTGYLHTELGRRQRRTASMRRLLGGETRTVDILTRSHLFLLRAIDRVAERDPTLRDKIEVHLAGVLSGTDKEVAEAFDSVRTHGYVPHKEAIRLMRSADLLFLPMQNLKPGLRSSTVPGKTYEYLASGRPILAAVPEGDAREIVRAAGGDVCSPDDVDAMADVILKRLAGRGSPIPPAIETRRFEYRRLALSLADLFERVSLLHTTPATVEPLPSVARPASSQAAKTVLHLAYFFPPIGGAGAQRSLKFVRYLPKFGYRSIVVTGVGDTAGRWTPSDETLNAEVVAGTDVRRVPGPEPAQPSGWKGRAQRWLAQPTEWSRWWISGIERAGAELQDVDVILASMSPYETAAAAARLSEESGKPWVAALRDPWALDEMMVFPTAWHRRRELRRMGRLLRSATAIIMTTPESVVRVRDAFPELRGKPIVCIPNGFDAADFEDDITPRDDDIFRIVHTGYLHTELGLSQRRTATLRRILGGQTQGVDILTRSHVYLLEAVERLLEREPSLRGRVEVHLAGVLSNADRKTAARSEFVRLHEYLAHPKALELIRTADLLFLPMQNLPPGMRSTTVPGKTYEYLRSGRPILAAVPEGDARDIVHAAGNSYVTNPNDIDGIASAIHAELTRWLRSEAPSQPAADVVARYDRRFLTAQLASVLDAVTDLPLAGSTAAHRAA